MNTKLQQGTVHKLPKILSNSIQASDDLAAKWNSFTPLARNEWICWVTSAKKEETKLKRVEVGISKMNNGMRRPCCWSGCPHRIKFN